MNEILSPAGGANPAPSSDQTQTGQSTVTPSQPAAQPAPSTDGQPPVVTNPGEPAADQQGNTEDGKSRNRVPFQERISQLTTQKNAAIARAEAAEAKLRTLEGGLKPPPPTAPQTEVDAYNVRKAVRDERVTEQRQEAQEAQAEAQTALFNTFAAKCEAVADRIPGLVDKFCSLPTVTPHMANFVADSDKGAEVANILASNPLEADRISRLPPFQQAIELTKLEATVSLVPQRVSNAPPVLPSTPNSAPGANGVDPAQMNQAQYEQWRKNGGGA